MENGGEKVASAQAWNIFDSLIVLEVGCFQSPKSCGATRFFESLQSLPLCFSVLKSLTFLDELDSTESCVRRGYLSSHKIFFN